MNGSYKHSFVNLCFTKNANDFENITSVLNINYEFKNFHVLLIRILENEQIKEIMKNRDENVLDNLMNSKYKISSAEQFMKIINMCPDKIYDQSYIKLLSDIKDHKINSNENDLQLNHDEYKVKAMTLQALDLSVNLIRDSIEKLNGDNEKELNNIKNLNNIIKEVFNPIIKNEKIRLLDKGYIEKTFSNTEILIENKIINKEIRTPVKTFKI